MADQTMSGNGRFHVSLFNAALGLVAALLMAGMTYIGGFVISANQQLGVQGSQISDVRDDISQIRASQERLLNDRYTSADASRDWSAQDRLNGAFQREINDLEKRVNQLATELAARPR